MAYHPLNIKIWGERRHLTSEILCRKKVDKFRQGVVKQGRVTESTNASLPAAEELQKLPVTSQRSMGCRGRGYGGVTITHLTNAPGTRIHTPSLAFTMPQLVQPTKDKALSQWPPLQAKRTSLQQSPCPGSS